MKILGIETSCDETGAAVIEASMKDQPVRLLSNSLASSLAKHSETGGIIPEIAAREQIKFILPVINNALENAKLNIEKPEIEAIAVTYGPGLIGSLLVGVETAKTLGYLWEIPIIPVNHLYGHIYANFVRENSKFKIQNSKFTIPQFPAIALVVSGGHTDLVLLKNHGNLQVIGGTRDDAAGEAFDKIGRLMGLSYPAGPTISKLAEKGNPKAFRLPRPMWDSKDFDFSFSGLKTSVLNLIKKNGWDFTKKNPVIPGSDVTPDSGSRTTITNRDDKLLTDLCASVQQAIIDVLVFKTFNAVKEYNVNTLILGGGVAANDALVEEFKVQSSHLRQGFGGQARLNVKLFVPPKKLCTDNAAMIAAAGFYHDNKVYWQDITANPELYY